MANPTTNYGWPMPTSTDLVTDLPADFDAFGQPVDTTLKALNPETTLGDIAYRSAVSNTNTRLGIGTAGQVLTVNSGATAPEWAAAAGGGINPNATINGGFDIWQRGASFTALGKTFTADRWWKFRTGDAGGGTWSRQDSATSAPGTQFCMRMQRDNADISTAALQLYSDFETNSSIIYAGQEITVSFYARKGANYSGGDFDLTLQTGTGTDQSQFAGFTSETTVLTVTATAASMNSSTFVRYTGTVTLATTVTQLGFKAIWTPTGTAGAADFVEIAGVKLEEGSSATDFVRAGGTLAGELAACQRYFQTYAGSSARTYVAQGSSFTATRAYISLTYPVPMRTSATLTLSSATHFTIAQDSQNFVGTSNAVEDVSSTGIWIDFTHGSGATGGRGATFYGNTTSARFQLSAELQNDDI